MIAPHPYPETVATSTSPSRRWHELDALRAFAMLLGIGLHAALSFYPSAWPVEDITASSDGLFDEAVLAIHGFRMPLFFLLSGLFTALLWRRRGLGALLGHRMRRIVLPLVLGLIVIVPTVDWVADRAVEAQLEDSGDLAAAAYLGYQGPVRAMLDGGADIDAPGRDGLPPLYLATVAGDAAMVDLLLERGADPNTQTAEGMAVDAAAYFGRDAIGEALVAAGSRDPRPVGGVWQDIAYWAQGTAAEAGVADDPGLLSWLPSLHHLWFLWFLVLFVLGFAPVAWLVDRLRDRRPAGRSRNRWAGLLMWLLVPLVLLPQLMMKGGETIAAFGPDTSITWIPEPAVFVYYLLFFTFGALLYGATDEAGVSRVEHLGRRWWLVLGLALAVFLLALTVTFREGDEWHLAASGLQVAYAWLMIIGLMGLFRALLSGEHHSVRYLSDSAYWQYLVHVTLVIALQSLVRTADLPAPLKFGLIVVTTSVILLMTYQLFVRYTPIGTLLNGRRARPARTGSRYADGLRAVSRKIP
jgi:ankyrin repeat protein